MRNVSRKQTHLQIRARLQQLDAGNVRLGPSSRSRYSAEYNAASFKGRPDKRFHIGEYNTAPIYFNQLRHKYKKDPAFTVRTTQLSHMLYHTDRTTELSNKASASLSCSPRGPPIHRPGIWR